MTVPPFAIVDYDPKWPQVCSSTSGTGCFPRFAMFRSRSNTSGAPPSPDWRRSRILSVARLRSRAFLEALQRSRENLSSRWRLSH
jgi:hypothetical protein